MSVFKVLTKKKYAFIAIAVTLLFIVFAAWLPNLHLITRTMTRADMTVWQKSSLLTGLLGSLKTNFTPLSRSITIISALLAGAQVSLLVYFISRSVQAKKEAGTSVLGLVFGILGVGCASCGSVLLTSLIGLGTATTIMGTLPLRGQELGLLGIGMLGVSLAFTVKKINDPLICGVDNKGGI